MNAQRVAEQTAFRVFSSVIPVVEIRLVVTPVLPTSPLVPSVELGFEEKCLYHKDFLVSRLGLEPRTL